jgi:H+-translocating NAD(P) transhydrogenase subunit alpha
LPLDRPAALGDENPPKLRCMSVLLLFRSSLFAATDSTAAGIDLTPFLELYVFLLAGFLGYQIITKVPSLLHTPLMSATNAISGISLVGSLVAAGATNRGSLSVTLGFIAVVAATINVVGGFMITDRMLKMFKRQEKK